MDQNLEKLEKSIENLKNKTSRIYLFVQDTKGNPKASVRYIYQLGLSLKNLGYNPIILHEKPDYQGVSEWLGEEYINLPHKSIEGQNLEVSPEDLIVIPEIYGFVMEQLKDLPCGKIVLCQAYDHMLETLQPGYGWANYGFFKCITTSEFQKEYISTVMRNISIDVLTPMISETFEKSKYPAKPFVAVHSRDPRKTINFIKTFYLKFPQYRWVTFRDMRGLTEFDFANFLKECFLSVWIDETSGFGTFPLESMKCGVPVIGKVPTLYPHWLNEENGIWVIEDNKIPDFVADFLQNWLEDNINYNLYDSMDKTVKDLPTKEIFQDNVDKLFSEYLEVREKSFTDQLNKLKIEKNGE
jgi:hypothetical protein